ncbi:MAG: cytosine deaminase [Microcoleus sp. PH2017_27_LUM_O_A]|uniref:cytosine deaminase n=1 Tax=Microcoleus sp. PH2017_27_LUM_O_A TaxID=2798837 RepID=UPI001DEBE03D|nr:cytosine deaminase [Microcoleus sp. PH2017_27_LUM_O_A]MCC3563551.1 cytosine deaminase [Microcoleus sp. PH2017_27_LUM_O_A]
MSEQKYSIVLRDCRLLGAGDRETVDIAIEDDTIAAVSPRISGLGDREIDIKGKLVCPPFVESHIHLDSALTAGEPRWNQSGTLFEGIQIWGQRKQGLTLNDVKKRAIETLRLQASQGILFVRSHADVSEPTLTALQGLLEVREEVKDWMTLQVVAFPQDGIYGSPGNDKLLDKSLDMGADAVGGIPHYELTREDGVKSVHRIFELAEKYNKLIDIHCDEIDDEQSRFLEVVAACAIRSGAGSRVTASHTTAFGSYNNAYAFKLMGILQKSGINFIANPLINITLQGRADSYPKRRGVTRVKELWQHGLNVSLGHDCVQDPWYSLGTGNMLDVAHMAVHVCQMTGMAEIAACFNMVTVNGAKTLYLGDDNYGIDAGKPANLIVLDAEDCYDAIRRNMSCKPFLARVSLIKKFRNCIQ